jgi:hypothetical protein
MEERGRKRIEEESGRWKKVDRWKKVGKKEDRGKGRREF